MVLGGRSSNPAETVVGPVMGTRAILLVGVVLVGLLVAPPPSPLHASYATSDSMEPTLSEGDAYLLVGGTPLEVDDVITYYSDEQEGYVTHRIVDRTDQGFVTRGDANPSTDQAGGAAPVERSQVLGEVVTIGGSLLVIPGLGTLAAMLSLWEAIALTTGGALVLQIASATRSSTPPRPLTVLGEVVRPLLSGSVIASLLVLVLTGTTYPVTYSVTEEEHSSPGVLTVDEPATRNITVHTYHPPVTTVVTEPREMTRVNRTVNGSTVEMTVRIPPPPEAGQYTGTVVVQPYPATLPRAWLRALHGVHPAVAMMVSTAVAFVPIGFLYGLMFDGLRPLRQPRWRWLRRREGESR